MQATRTPAGTASGASHPEHHRAQLPPASRPAEPSTPILSTHSDQEFLSHFGDTIDDRIAEILDELLEERNAARPLRLPQVLVTISLLLALAASVLLDYSPLAFWTIWPATAAICLTIARTTRTGRS